MAGKRVAVTFQLSASSGVPNRSTPLSLRRAPGDIAACAEHPARDFRSAMRSFNFFFALDCYDSAGRFDDYMGEFYNGEPDAQMWLEELYRAVDLHDGWHFLHTAKHPAFTRLCLRAHKLRRPNSGLLAGPETPPERGKGAVTCRIQSRKQRWETQ